MNNELTLADRKSALMNTLTNLKATDLDESSNFKLINLIRSRLTEEGIPLDVATQIVANLTIDVTGLNEDDDFLGDIALAYAEFAAGIYFKLQGSNWHRNLTDTMIRKYFTHVKIVID